MFREVVLIGGASLSVAAQRFDRRGLAGLIAWPAAEPRFSARLRGAARPAWSPRVDPRLEALADGFQLLLASTAGQTLILEGARSEWPLSPGYRPRHKKPGGRSAPRWRYYESVTAVEGHEVVGEFLDDGYSGARLDRPGLDAIRDAAEAGLIDAVWCLSPDRLARVYAYQVIVLDELARHGVSVLFADAPAFDDDPQARLLTQVQGVIAEYERAKNAERYRRGKLWRARAGEVISLKAPYGYRRLPRSADAPPRLEIYEPEAAVVRHIFDDYVAGGHSTREITRRLNTDGCQRPPASGRCGDVNCLGDKSKVIIIHCHHLKGSPSPTSSSSTTRKGIPSTDVFATDIINPLIVGSPSILISK